MEAQGMQPASLLDRVSAAIRGNKVARLSSLAVVIALALNLIVYIAGLSTYLSHKGVYTELQLGMSRAAAIEILQRNKIGCGIVYPRQTPPLGCEFWDLWRDYQIGFAPGSNGQLESKSFTYRHRGTSVAAVVQWLHSKQ